MSVLIVTSVGDLVVDLFATKCPLTSKNFLKLCKIKYYNGCLFHTVQKDFTAQTGDPTGKGTGGDSVYKFLYGDQARFFSDEIHLELKHSNTGTIAMASAGENLNASQFYFTLRDDLDYLDGKHTVFGELAEGFDTLTRINEAYVDEKGRPYKNIRIKHTYILEDPFDDPPQLAELIPEASPTGKPKDELDDDVRLEDDWVPLDEQLDPIQLEEVIKAKAAHSSATVLELVGDIPDADIRPPDNVLFVCKLNPVTEDEDLHTIFSRFGHVVSSEIIRDYKTGDSLCYAFIEFETKESCEEAYFKMDNALIDDRRIHVDFSQSVAKLWLRYRLRDGLRKGKGCYTCGALDHIANDCIGAPEPSKYILNDERNGQRGGVDASRYGMVFEDYDSEQSLQKKDRHQNHGPREHISRHGNFEQEKQRGEYIHTSAKRESSERTITESPVDGGRREEEPQKTSRNSHRSKGRNDRDHTAYFEHEKTGRDFQRSECSRGDRERSRYSGYGRDDEHQRRGDGDGNEDGKRVDLTEEYHHRSDLGHKRDYDRHHKRSRGDYRRDSDILTNRRGDQNHDPDDDDKRKRAHGHYKRDFDQSRYKRTDEEDQKRIRNVDDGLRKTRDRHYIRGEEEPLKRRYSAAESRNGK